MRNISAGPIALLIGIATLLLPWAAHASNPPSYVLSPWRAGTVGNCLVTDKNMTSDCEFAPTAEGYRMPASLADKLLNNRSLPGAPAGKRVWVMFKLEGAAKGLPPDAAQAAATEIHLNELQHKYYPSDARAAKIEGRSSANCIVLDDGQLDNCWIASEVPADAGFGAATLNLMNLIQLTSPLPADRKQSFDMTWRPPGPSEQVFVNCLVTPDSMTSDCKTDPDPDYPGAAQAVLGTLTNHPLHLSGAPAGQRIEIALVRSELDKPQTSGNPGSQSTPYKPIHQTALAGSDIEYYYPPLAIRLNKTGVTQVQCKVTDDGRLNECWATYDQANSDLLTHAHLRLTEMIRMQPPAANAPVYDKRLYAFRVTWTLSE